MDNFRLERDSMGEVKVPQGAYYGAQTQRALENFTISNLRFPRSFIRALGMIKRAAAETNLELDLLPEHAANAIIQAAREVTDGELDDHFVVDVFQTGSGTSTNMNANEVIANRAAEILGRQLGEKIIHPNDHVNLGQSSNDVIPSALHIAAMEEIERTLLPALHQLHAALAKKAEDWDGIVKVGRTHLQDAVPIRLGQEFSGYASVMSHGITRIEGLRRHLSELAIGGTAVGTGLNCHRDFPGRVVRKIRDWTGLSFREAENRFEALGCRDAAVEASGMLKTVAVGMMKIANDVRWLGSGPRCGLAELNLPSIQPGSSIMPGKVNPVIAESACMAAAQILGNDVSINIAGQAGNLELNVMKPLIVFNLLQSISVLSAACRSLAEKCIDGLEVNQAKLQEDLDQSLALATALVPRLGYDKAAEIAAEAHKQGQTIREVCRKREILRDEELAEVLDPLNMT